MDIFKNISWNIKKPLSSIVVRHNDVKYSYETTEAQQILNSKAPIYAVNKLVILSTINETVALSENITKNQKYYTVLDVLRAIHRGMNRTIIPGDRHRNHKKYRLEHDVDKNSFVYCKIGGYRHEKKFNKQV